MESATDVVTEFASGHSDRAILRAQVPQRFVHSPHELTGRCTQRGLLGHIADVVQPTISVDASHHSLRGSFQGFGVEFEALRTFWLGHTRHSQQKKE